MMRNITYPEKSVLISFMLLVLIFHQQSHDMCMIFLKEKIYFVVNKIMTAIIKKIKIATIKNDKVICYHE